MSGYISEAIIKRLPGYYRHLRELEDSGVTAISSRELGERMNLTASQIRQDINSFGGFGTKGFGYNVQELKECIRGILGLDREHRMIICGAGAIGTAVTRYPSFRREGFRALALFDRDPKKAGTRIGGLPVLPMEELEAFLAEEPADIAVLALPAAAAQETLDRLTACGLTAFWNFAPTDLRFDPARITVVNVHLSDSLQVLAYKLKHRGE